MMPKNAKILLVLRQLKMLSFMNFMIPFESLLSYPEEEKELLKMGMFMTEYLFHLTEKQDATIIIDSKLKILLYNEGSLPFGLKVGQTLPEGTVTSQALKTNSPVKIRKSKEESAFKIAYIGSALPIQGKDGLAVGAVGYIYSTEKWDIVKESSSVTSRSIRLILDSFQKINQSSKRSTISANEAYNQILETEKKIDSIKEVIHLIKKIADQTNMLSLNASIEAARAGDAGKGFEVVAMEVGKLANNTKHSLATMTNGLRDIVLSTKLLSSKVNQIKSDSLSQEKIILSMQEKVSEVVKDLENVEALTKKITG